MRPRLWFLSEPHGEYDCKATLYSVLIYTKGPTENTEGDFTEYSSMINKQVQRINQQVGLMIKY